MANQTARLIPHGDAASPLGLHLVLGGEQPGETTAFRVLSTEDDLARVLYAEIKGDDETVVENVALKILPNSFPAPLAGAGPEVTNSSLEERWEVERRRLLKLRSTGSLFPRILQLDFHEKQDQRRLPPLFYCRVGRCFFVPPCPRCFAPLETCRDDALLVSHGLPPYTSSLERFLHCAACAVRTESLVFYSFVPWPERGRVRVGSAADLIEEIGRGLAADWPEKRVEAFPCACCRAAVRPTKSGVVWTERWSVFTFHDTPYLLTGLSPLDLDQMSDLLGGRPWETLHVTTGAPLEKAPGLLFAHDGSGMDAVETLFLKLTAFRQLADSVLQYQRLAGGPHLDIHPRHVLFDLPTPGEGLPALWSFHTRLHGLSTAARPLPFEGATGAVLPPRNPVVPFAPPEIVEFQLAGVRPAEVVFSELTGTSGETRLVGRLTDPYGVFPNPQPRDLVVLNFQGSVDLGVPTIAVRVQDGAPPGATFRAFASEPLRLDDASTRRVRKTLGVRLSGVSYKVYSEFGAPSDIYSLGVVLLRLLLANDGQDIGAVTRAAGRVLASAAGAGPEPRLKSLLTRAPETAPVFAPANVFYSSVDRVPTRANAIPDLLWERVVVLAMRLVGRAEGFSLCRDHTDFDPANPAAKIGWIVEQAELLCTELRTLLFSRHGVNLEVQQVLAEILADESPNEPA